MINDRIYSSGDLQNFISMITKTSENGLPNIWKNVVSKIGKREDENDNEVVTLGEKLAANSHVVDLKNGVLLVEANHPGFIQYLKMYQKFILKGLNWALPDLKINNLAFRLAGSNANLSVDYEEQAVKAKNEMNKKIEDTEKQLEKLNLNKNDEKNENKNGGELPPELLERFERLKSSMLTNSKE